MPDIPRVHAANENCDQMEFHLSRRDGFQSGKLTVLAVTLAS
jgi:hypothetical protein